MRIARDIGFIPLCFPDEAAALSRRHQPEEPDQAPRKFQASDGADVQSLSRADKLTALQNVLTAAAAVGRRIRQNVRWLLDVLTAFPHRSAAWAFRTMPAELLFGLCEGMPWAESFLLRVKRLSLGPSQTAKALSARRLLVQSGTDAEFCASMMDDTCSA